MLYKYFSVPSYMSFYQCVCYVPRSITYPVQRVPCTVHLLLPSSLTFSALMFKFCFLLFLLYLLFFCPFTSLYVISIHPFVLSYLFANSSIVLSMNILLNFQMCFFVCFFIVFSCKLENSITDSILKKCSNSKKNCSDFQKMFTFSNILFTITKKCLRIEILLRFSKKSSKQFKNVKYEHFLKTFPIFEKHKQFLKN